MSLVLVSPNMLLPVPIVSQEPGPDWATDINACLSIIDQHNHASGSGVQIGPNGLNISSDLTFLSNNAISLRSARFSAQGSVLSLGSDIGCLYVVGNELYYNDVTGGHNIQITTNGSVNAGSGSISGLPSGTASASYSAGTFVWQSATSTAANMDAQSYVLRNSSAGSKGLTLSAPAAMAADYSLVLPSLPAQTNVLTLDNTGNMSSVTWNAVANNRSRSVASTVGVGGVAISASCGLFSAAGSSIVPVTNLSVTITTSGRPVWVGMIPDTSGSQVLIGSAKSSTTITTSLFEIWNGGNLIGGGQLSTSISATGFLQIIAPVGSIYTVDTPAAGTYTYTIMVAGISGGPTVTQVQNARLLAYEL